MSWLKTYGTLVSCLFPALAKGRIENTHANYEGAVTLSGQDGEDAKKYQEKQVKRAIEEVEK